MPAKRKSNKKRINTGSEQMADAGGGSPYQFGMMGPNSMDYGLQRPDFRSQSGLGWDAPDPIKRPIDKIRVVYLPGPTVYVPVPKKPKKRNGRLSGGGGVSGAE
jgi:hypothetical protein